MAGLAIPEIINNFNVYSAGNSLIGISGAVTLPTFDAETESISGAGILGSYDTAVPGFFSSMTQEVPFRTLDNDIFSLMNPNEPLELTFRAAQQSTVKSTGALTYKGMRIVERGRLKSFNAGSLEQTKAMGASVTLELLYILVEVDGTVVLEYDKLNNVFKAGGKDLLANVLTYC